MIDRLVSGLQRQVQRARSTAWRETLYVRSLGWRSIPMLGHVRPRVIEPGPARCRVALPLSRFNRNHLGSMYLGALVVGADVTGGFLAWQAIEQSGHKISLVFKDLRCEFLKRPQGEVHFVCEQGEELRALVRQAEQSDERVEMTAVVVATVPELDPSEPVARFELTLSLKKRS